VGHGYAGTIVSKVVEAIPERVRRLVFWSAYILNDGETALEMLPDSVDALTQMAADSDDNTFMIPFDMWRDVFINDGDPDLVHRAYDQLSPEPFGPWAEPLNMEKFHSLQTPRSFLVGAAGRQVRRSRKRLDDHLRQGTHFATPTGRCLVVRRPTPRLDCER
jgi:pimeloyl-ACP methyl ester carboxylesterase